MPVHDRDYHRAHCHPRKHPRPAKPNAVITGWFGQKLDSTHATVTITGEGFGNVSGSVKLIAQGLGSKVASIVSWTENAIVVEAPVNKIITSATVLVLNERGKDKKAATTPKKEQRSTNTPVPTWTVATIDDSELAITITGSDLADVEDVFLYDNDAVQFIEAAAFALDGSDLVIEWPASFVSPIVTIVLSDGNGGNITQNDPSPSLEPAANGILTDVSTSAAGNSSIVSLIGSGLGEDAGSVVLVRVGGLEEPASVLVNGWSPTVVQVVATPGTEYESAILTRSDTEVAALAASFPASFTSASVGPVFTVGYDPDADLLSIGSSDPLFFGENIIVYSTVQYGAGYSVGTADGALVVVSPTLMTVPNADSHFVGPNTIVDHMDFINGVVGLYAAWDGTITIAAA